MVDITIKKGLDLVLEGPPRGELKTVEPSKLIALELSAFREKRFHLLCRVGDHVLKGQSLLCEKSFQKRVWVAPACGKIVQILRGEKRQILAMVIEKSPKEQEREFFARSSTKEEFIDSLLESGLFSFFRRRPYDLLADPMHLPACIFVKAIESAPFLPSAEMQVQRDLDAFEYGLTLLSQIAQVHIACKRGSLFRDFEKPSKGILSHTFSGPHPVANASLHIEHIHPIRSAKDLVWTIKACDVLRIGHFFKRNTLMDQRVVSLGGAAVLPQERGFYLLRDGMHLQDFLATKLCKKAHVCIRGDVLSGNRCQLGDFLGFYDASLSVLLEAEKRELFSFLRPGFQKNSASRAYISSFLGRCQNALKNNLKHGEARAFIDPEIYQRVMPLPIRVQVLLKAILVKDFDLAEKLGLLEVAGEDFALPAFVCPSKIEMLHIVENALREFEHA